MREREEGVTRLREAIRDLRVRATANALYLDAIGPNGVGYEESCAVVNRQFDCLKRAQVALEECERRL